MGQKTHTDMGSQDFRREELHIGVDTEGISIVDFETGAENLKLTPENYTGTQNMWEKTEPLGQEIDLENPVRFVNYAKDGREQPFFVLGQRKQEFTETDREDRIELAERLASDGQTWWEKIAELEALKDSGTIEVGGYHPVMAAMLYTVGRTMWSKAEGLISYRDKNISATKEDYENEIKENWKNTDDTTEGRDHQ